MRRETVPTAVEEPTAKPRTSLRTLVLVAVLVGLAGAAVFAPAIGGPFILDDRTLILNNPFVHALGQWKAWLRMDFWGGTPGLRIFQPGLTYFRPGVTASYALDWHLGGGSPVVFHLTNLFAYAVASGLTFWTLRRWIGAWWPALLAALIVTVHPTRAESVAWISGRTDVLCAIGILAAAAGAARRLAGRRGGLVLEFAGTLWAYLTKETAVVLPAFVAVEAWVAAGRPALDLKAAKRMLIAGAPQLGVAAAYLGARAVWLPLHGHAPAAAVFRPLLAHTELVLETVGRAAALCLAPVWLTLGEGTQRFASGPRALFSLPYVAFGGAVLVALVVGVAATRRRAPGVAVGLLLFCATLAPTSNLLPTRLHSIFADRFLFFPLLGLGLALGFALSRLQAPRRAASTACLAISVLLGVGAVARAQDFSNRRAFWTRELRLNPENTQALGAEIEMAIHDRRYGTALRDLARCHAVAAHNAAISGGTLMPLLKAADLLSDITPDAQQDRLAHLDAFYAALLDPAHHPVARLSAGVIRGDQPLTGSAVHALLARLAPHLLAAHAELAGHLGHPRVATDAARAALRGCPHCAEVVTQAALVLAREGHYRDALGALGELARFRGHDDFAPLRQRIQSAQSWGERARRARGPAALQARATELSKLGAYGRAFDVLSPYEEQIRRSPGMVMGYAELAWRSGHFDAARRVLADRMSPSEIARTTRAWSNKLRWVER